MTAPGDPPDATPPRRRGYALAVLTAVYTLNLVDRGLIAVLLQPIKEDLGLTDTQLGLLTGIAFGLFYAVAGVPIARWADRGDRVRITALAIGAWSLTVMACLLVTSFVQLLFARMAAAVGEAGCKPPTYSLVGDYYPEPAQRTRAMAVYWLGNPLATLVSFALGGWLNEQVGWRMAFLIMGLPGLILALIVLVTLRDPRRDRGRAREPSRPAASLGAVVALLWRQPSLRHLTLALVLLYTMGAGLSPWYAAFMIRSHGMATTELGVALGLVFCVGGIAGVLAGGWVASRWFADNERGQMRVSGVAVAAFMPSLIAFLLAPTKGLALAALFPVIAAFSFFMGPTYAVMQRLVPDDMRATVMAVVMLLANLIGMGLGPQIVGVLSDLLAPSQGADSLRYAMLACSVIALWSAGHFWRVGRTIRQDLDAAEAAR